MAGRLWDAADRNFQFYVRTGTFGDLNSGNNIQIPANIQIFTAAPKGPIYLIDVVTLLAGSSVQSFSATSVSTGSSGNTSSGVFTRHNFTNYTQSAAGGLLVANNYGIIGGRDTERDTEDDDSCQYR